MQRRLTDSDILVIERRLQYTFKDKSHLQTAFTHGSYAHEHGIADNERLEFLGDSILNMVVSFKLYQTGKNEGDMTACRQQIVSAMPLEEAVLNLNVATFVQCSADVQKNGEKWISSLYEAIIAAIFLDSGLQPVIHFIERTLLISGQAHGMENYKGKLQEFLQGIGQPTANYSLLKEEEIEGEHKFTVKVQAMGFEERAVGRKRRDAEQLAAKQLLNKLQKQLQ